MLNGLKVGVRRASVRTGIHVVVSLLYHNSEIFSDADVVRFLVDGITGATGRANPGHLVAALVRNALFSWS